MINKKQLPVWERAGKKAAQQSFSYYMVFKPYGMLSQFTQAVEGQVTLSDLGGSFPPDVYPVGRLDADSEGLLLLTNDTSLNARLLNPSQGHVRTYWAQVEGIPTEEALEILRSGIDIQVDGKKYHTLPAGVIALPGSPPLPERNPPIRFRKTVPDTWIELTLREGKNRQVRRMCAAAGYPVLRLVRVRMGDLAWGQSGLGNLAPGEIIELDAPRLEALFRHPVL